MDSPRSHSAPEMWGGFAVTAGQALRLFRYVSLSKHPRTL